MSGQKSERWLRCAFVAVVAVAAAVGVSTFRSYTHSQEHPGVWSSKGVLAATDVVDALPPQDDKKRMGLLAYTKHLLREFKNDPVKFVRFKQKIKRLLSRQTSKRDHRK